jgi:hypothetical protein
MANGSWDKSMNILDSPYYEEIILNWFQIEEYSSPVKEYLLILDESKVKSLARDP